MAEAHSDTYVVKFPRPVRFIQMSRSKHLFYDDEGSYVADMALYPVGTTVKAVSVDDVTADADTE